MTRGQLNVNELFSNIDRHTSFKEDLVIWLGLRAGDYHSIEFMYPDAIASTRYGKDSVYFENKLSLLSTEKHTKTRTDSSMEELEPYLVDFLSSLKGSQRVHIVGYHSTPYLENLVSQFPNIKMLNPSSKTKRFLDKKTKVRKILSDRGVKCIPGVEEVVSTNPLEQFDKLAKKYDLPIVVQFDDSASGSGVYLVENFSDFYDMQSENVGKNAIFSKFIDGKSMNVNAVRTKNLVVFSEPSFQIIGQKPCTNRRFGYCGNDFNIGSKVSDEQIKDIFETTEKVGDWMGSIGYYGMFGVDFMVDDNNVYFTEINPRFQGSTSLLVDRQIEMGKIPLSFFHLVPYLDGLTVDEWFIQEYNKSIEPTSVSQILLHNLSGRDVTLKSSLNPGRYTFEDGDLEYVGPANFLSETKSSDEIVIGGDIPVNGTRVLRNSDEICRIYSYYDVLDKHGRNLNSFGKELAEKVYSQLEFD